MNYTDKYDHFNEEHRLVLEGYSKRYGKLCEAALRELSGAMHTHGVAIGGLERAIGVYIKNPFGKYFYLGEIDNAAREAKSTYY